MKSFTHNNPSQKNFSRASLWKPSLLSWSVLGKILLFVLLMILPNTTWASGEPTWEVHTFFGTVSSETALESYVFNFLNSLYTLIGSITVLRLLTGAYKYISTNGNPEDAKSAKETIIHAITGCALVLLAYVITNVFVDFESTFNWTP